MPSQVSPFNGKIHTQFTNDQGVDALYVSLWAIQSGLQFGLLVFGTQKPDLTLTTLVKGFLNNRRDNPEQHFARGKAPSLCVTPAVGVAVSIKLLSPVWERNDLAFAAMSTSELADREAVFQPTHSGMI